jgi:hypothetical protein
MAEISLKETNNMISAAIARVKVRKRYKYSVIDRLYKSVSPDLDKWGWRDWPTDSDYALYRSQMQEYLRRNGHDRN